MGIRNCLWHIFRSLRALKTRFAIPNLRGLLHTVHPSGLMCDLLFGGKMNYQAPFVRIDMAFEFLTVKQIPTLAWSSPRALTFKPPILSLVTLIFGLFLFGLGEALLVAAGIGVSPWTVFAEGLV